MSKHEEQAPEEVLDASPEIEEEADSVVELMDDPIEGSVEEMGSVLEDARAKADEHWNEALRLRAEMDNLRKRQVRDLENAHKFALDKIANELLGVRDSLELGVEAAQAEEADVNALREGSELTLKMLAQVMEKFNIIQLNPEGEKFNPELHQAITMIEVPGAEANTVINVYQKGYTLNDRLIRPASVVVAKG